MRRAAKLRQLDCFFCVCKFPGYAGLRCTVSTSTGGNWGDCRERGAHPSGSGGFGGGAAHAVELVLPLRQGTSQAGCLGSADVAAALHVGLQLGQLSDRAFARLQINLQLPDLRPANFTGWSSDFLISGVTVWCKGQE